MQFPLAVVVVLVLMLTGPLHSASAVAQPCLGCHPSEVQRFESSAMGQSLSAVPQEPGGSFTHALSGSQVTISRTGGVMHQRIRESNLTADYPVAYSVGYGNVGKSYLIELGGHLFQSPAAFYTKRSEWDVSPGYETEKLLDFSRPITSDCLTCHAGSITKTASETKLVPLTCERCHGPAETHLRRPVPGSIVNPARLTGRARDSVCEQCHLEGAGAILNPGRSWSDFQPGQVLETNETHYVYLTRNGDHTSVAAVSHAEQLALSACLRNSNGKLWCGTCHSGHGDGPDRKAKIQAVCHSCHSGTQLAAAHSPGQDNCIGCHMPQRKATDVSHAAITDHRILRRPAAMLVDGEETSVQPWRPAEPPALGARNFGLALFRLAKRKNLGEAYARSFEILSKLAPGQMDSEVNAARGYMLLGAGQSSPAVALFEKAAAEKPADAEYWLDLGVADEAAGHSDQALLSFRRSITANPYDYRPYKALSGLYESLHQPDQATAAVADFLKLVPQSILMRSAAR